MTVTLLRADAGRIPMADGSVDLIVTSPPYWALRSYQDGGEHYAGQIGAEPTPAEYVESLIRCTREWMRVLKPSGSMWVNLGDKYTSASGGSGSAGHGGRKTGEFRLCLPRVANFRDKSLIGLPWRYAIRCIDDLGMILRAEVIWSKSNGLPESVTDRVRRSHETWFHLTKEPRYFAAVDAIRERHSHPGLGMTAEARRKEGRRGERALLGAREADMVRGNNSKAGHFLGKLPGSVWTVATQPLKVPAALGVDHFAAFPMEWPRRIIQGWSPSGICTACGDGRRPVVEVTRHGGRIRGEVDVSARSQYSTSAVITGEACACPVPTAPTQPAVVLDPFGGTGTTALVAHAYGRHGVSVDMSADYLRLAQWRTTDPAQLAKAGNRPTPKSIRRKARVGQLELFDA